MHLNNNQHIKNFIKLGTPPAISYSVKISIKLALALILALSITTPPARSDDGTDSSKTQSENSDSQKQSENSDSKSQAASSESKSQEGESSTKVAVDNTPNVSPVQAAARPFNLDITGPVYLAGSDARSAAFQANELPAMMNTVNQNLGEFKPLSDISSKALDPSKLVLSTDA